MANDVTFTVTFRDDGTPVIRNIKREVDTMGGGVDAAAKRANNGLGGLTSAFHGLRAALPTLAIGALALQAVSLADTSAQLAGRLKLVTDSAEELRATEQALFSVAQQTRSSYEGTVGLYVSLAKSTQDLGLSQGDLIRTTTQLNQLTALSGASSEASANALFQLSQAFRGGTLRAEEFNSIIDQAPEILETMAKGMGLSMGEFRARVVDGGIAVDELLGSLRKMETETEERFGKLPVTVGQAFTQLGNEILRFVGAADKGTGSSNLLARAVQGIARAIAAVTDSGYFERLGDEIDRVLGVSEKSRLTKELVAAQDEAQRLAGIISTIRSAMAEGRPMASNLIAATPETLKRNAAAYIEIQARIEQLQQALAATAQQAQKTNEALAPKPHISPEIQKLTEDLTQNNATLAEQAMKLQLGERAYVEYVAQQTLAKAKTDDERNALLPLVEQYRESSLAIIAAKEAKENKTKADELAKKAMAEEEDVAKRLLALTQGLRDEDEKRQAALQSVIDKTEARISVDRETARVIQAGIAAGRTYDDIQRDLAITLTEIELKAQGVTDGVHELAVAQVDAAGAADQQRQALENLKNAASDAFLSTRDLADAGEQIIEGFLQGTRDVEDLFGDLGRAAVTKFGTQFIAGKKDAFDVPLIGNVNSLLGLPSGGMIGAILGQGGQAAAQQFGSAGTTAANIFGGGLIGGINGFVRGLPGIGNLFTGFLDPIVDSVATSAGNLVSSLLGGQLGNQAGVWLNNLVLGAFDPVTLAIALAVSLPSIIGLFNQPGRIQLEKKEANKFFESVFEGTDFKIKKEPQVAAGLLAFGPDVQAAGQALGALYAKGFGDEATQGTIVRFGGQFLANLQAQGLSLEEAQQKVSELAQAMGFELGPAIADINSLTGSGLLTISEFQEEIGEARKNLKEYGDTSGLTANQLSQLALEHGNTGSKLVTLNQLYAGAIAIASGYSKEVNAAALANRLLAEEFTASATETGLYNESVQSLADQVHAGTLSIEEAIVALNDLRTAAGLAKLDLQDFTLDPAQVTEAINQIQTNLQNATGGFGAGWQAVWQGLTEGLTAPEAIAKGKAAFEQFFKNSMANALVSKGLTEGLGQLLDGFDLTQPIDLSSEAFTTLKERAGQVYDNIIEILRAAGLLPDQIAEATDEMDALSDATEKWAYALESAATRANLFQRRGWVTLEPEFLEGAAAMAEDISGQFHSSIFNGIEQALAEGGEAAARAQIGENLRDVVRNTMLQALTTAAIMPLLQPLIAGMATAGKALEDGTLDSVGNAAAIDLILQGVNVDQLEEQILRVQGIVSDTVDKFGGAKLGGDAAGTPTEGTADSKYPPGQDASGFGSGSAVGAGGGGGGGGASQQVSEFKNTLKEATDALRSFIDSATRGAGNLASDIAQIDQDLNEALALAQKELGGSRSGGSLFDRLFGGSENSELRDLMEQARQAAAEQKQTLVNDFLEPMREFIAASGPGKDALADLIDEYNEHAKAIQDNAAILSQYVDVNQTLHDLYASLLAQAEELRGELLDPIQQAIAELLDTAGPGLADFLQQISAATTFDELQRISDEGTAAIVENYRRQEEAARQAAERMLDLAQGIRESLDEMRTGSSSFLSPTARADEAARQFREALSAGLGGDLDAAQRAAGLGRSAIDLFREVFGSSSTSLAFSSEVEQGLAQLAALLDAQGTAQNQLADSLQQQTIAELQSLQDALTSRFDELIDTVQEQNVQVSTAQTENNEEAKETNERLRRVEEVLERIFGEIGGEAHIKVVTADEQKLEDRIIRNIFRRSSAGEIIIDQKGVLRE